jgi:hypothetical protein
MIHKQSENQTDELCTLSELGHEGKTEPRAAVVAWSWSTTAANKQSQEKQNASLIEATMSIAGEKAAHWVLEELRPNQ